MTLSTRIAKARDKRSERRAVHAHREAVIRELATYSSPAERKEIELLASRTPGPGANLVLDLLDRLPVDDNRRAPRIFA
jgi:hypothetical protein